MERELQYCILELGITPPAENMCFVSGSRDVGSHAGFLPFMGYPQVVFKYRFDQSRKMWLICLIVFLLLFAVAFKYLKLRLTIIGVRSYN